MTKFFVGLLACLLAQPLPAQQLFRVMAYNVENLFDVVDNPATNDNEFLPTGNRHWSGWRYQRKLQQLAKVIAAAGAWDTPAVIGLCEVENDSVVCHLCRRTPLWQQDYRYLTAETDDPRGIRTALLYQRDQFGYLCHESIPIRFTSRKHKQTRHILHAWGKIQTGDTLDLFVCHFPSRYGGEKESQPDRIAAARTLRSVADSIRAIRQHPLLILMGDFNDTAQDRSLVEILQAHPLSSQRPATYYNLFAEIKRPFGGSHKHQGEWSQIDHIIVNQALVQDNAPLRLLPESIRLFAPHFLLTDDKTWRGHRPLRTYHGFKYEGGFSDHLPLIVDFSLHLPAQTVSSYE